MLRRRSVRASIWLFFINLTLLAAAGGANAASPLSINRITPDGHDVQAGRQLVIKFNRPVVPLGRMERHGSEIPVRISPKLNCEWRWMDTSSLACQLGEADAMRLSTTYQITVDPGIKAEDGAGLNAAVHHSFTTATPKVDYTNFTTWKAPGVPVIMVTFNQPVGQSSVEKHLYYTYGKGQRLTLKATPADWEKQAPQYLWVKDAGGFVDFGEQPARRIDEQKKYLGAEAARRVWLVMPEKEIPGDTLAQLAVEPGLRSALGPELGKEKRVAVEFETFPVFSFAGISCTSTTDEKITLSLKSDAPAISCDPMQPVELNFSAPPPLKEIKTGLTFTPDLAGGRKDFDPWESDGDYDQLNRPRKKRGKRNPDANYQIALPGNLKAATRYHIAGTLKDAFGRTLNQKIDFSFATDHRRPNFKVPNNISVIEKGIDNDVPLYVQNLSSVQLSYDLKTTSREVAGQSLVRQTAQVADTRYGMPLGIREVLKGEAGAVFGTVTSTPKVDNRRDEDPWFFAQITPFHVHAKAGHFNSLVWVTDLASGAPVAHAKVHIFVSSYPEVTKKISDLGSGETDEHGIAMLPGLEKLDPNEQFAWHNCRREDCLFVRVEKANDQAVLPLGYDFHISSYDIGSNVWANSLPEWGHMKAWGTTAQGVYRAGDTIQYKLFVRNQNNRTLVPAPAKTYTLKIVDPTGTEVETRSAIELSAFGAYSGEFKVPQTGAVGWYTFSLAADFTKRAWEPMRVLVSDFTPSPFHVAGELSGDLFRAEETVKLTATAKLHSGGPYTSAAGRVTAFYQGRSITADNEVAKGFSFTSPYEDEGDYEGNPKFRRQTFLEKTVSLDQKGELKLDVPLHGIDLAFGDIYVETAIKDERGKFVASLAKAAYRGYSRYIGLRPASWVQEEGKTATVDYIVIDENLRPVADAPVEITIKYLETKESQVKGAGDAYLTQFVSTWVDTGDHCQGKSASEPTSCKFTPMHAGSYRFVASVKDTKGRDEHVTLETWTVGKGHVVWDTKSQHTLPIIPEADSYRVGDKARYLVKNPYPGAEALITVERYGILKSWTMHFAHSTEVVEFPIEPDYLPGFYLSIVVSSPRAAAATGFGELDLGKPAFRMSTTLVPVKDPYKEIAITAVAEKPTYRPRDKVHIDLTAKPRHAPGDGEAKIELAAVVLDEAVYDLILSGKSYFDPYQGFYKLDNLDVQNYSLLLRLIGRQHFEKKGANPGGDGGKGLSLRDLFKFVAYWNPTVPVDSDGNAHLDFILPDNLTGWKILVMATTPGDRVGLGEGHFTTNRPTEIRPVLPNQVTEGDNFLGGFSVMNRTDKAREIKVAVKVSGNSVATAQKSPYQETLALGPYEKKIFSFPVKAAAVPTSLGSATGNIAFDVTAEDSLDGDRMTQGLPVHKLRSFLTAANYGTTTDKDVEESVLFPKDMHTDVGRIAVTTAPSVIGNVEGAFKYLRDYYYSCWEQKLTKGTMAAHYLKLKDYLPDTFSWPEATALPQTTLDFSANYQTPSGAMAYYLGRDEYADPYLSAYTAVAFRWLRAEGFAPPANVENKLHDYLLKMLRDNVFPTFYSEGMTSSVRAVALAALTEAGKATEADVRRYEQHMPSMDLFGKAHFLMAALKFDGTAAAATATAKVILSSGSESGGKFAFSEQLDDSYTRILATPLRANCAILTAFSRLAATESGKKLVGEAPFKLVRMITQTRKARDFWENTQENMFCMSALVDYSRAFEQVKPQMTVTAAVNGKSVGSGKFSDLRDKMLTFERPLLPTDPGTKAKVTLSRSGEGRLYYATTLQYAPNASFAERINAGIEVHREFSVKRGGKWELLGKDLTLARGEVVRVDLYVSLPTARNFVVIDDPIPGGLEPVNRDLNTASTADADAGSYLPGSESWYFHFGSWIDYNVSRWSFYHQELRHDAARFYSEYLPPGNYHVSYTAQAIAPGEFEVMPTQVEEMYDPDVYGKDIAYRLKVGEH